MRYALASLTDRHELETRLENLRQLGYVDEAPNRTQLLFGSIDMFRFFFVPARSDYHDRTSLSFRFHMLLRFLEDPAALMDPIGFVSHRDTIIGHVMGIVHCDPIYDLQLLAAIPGGTEELERQLEQVLAGTHPRGDALTAMIEEPDYHARLLEHVREFRANPAGCRRLVRQNVLENPDFAQMVEIFGDLPSTMAYFASLPERPLAALRRLIETREIPVARPKADEPETAANEGGADQVAA